jgi:hypothetical protein
MKFTKNTNKLVRIYIIYIYNNNQMRYKRFNLSCSYFWYLFLFKAYLFFFDINNQSVLSYCSSILSIYHPSTDGSILEDLNLADYLILSSLLYFVDLYINYSINLNLRK